MDYGEGSAIDPWHSNQASAQGKVLMLGPMSKRKPLPKRVEKMRLLKTVRINVHF